MAECAAIPADIGELRRLATPTVLAWLGQLSRHAQEKRRYGNTLHRWLEDEPYEDIRWAHVQRANFMLALLDALEAQPIPPL